MEYFSSTVLFVKWTLLAGIFLVIFSLDSVAQQTETPKRADSAKVSQATSSEAKPPESLTPAAASGDPTPASSHVNNGAITTAKQTPKTSKDRLFFTFPNFLTLENAGSAPPLTSSDKFKVVTQSSFDYVKFFWYGALAGIGQAENSQSGYGQGAAGYGKRYGAVFADGTIEDYMTSAVLPSLLHQDPRYFQLGKGGFWHRTGYAMSRIVITRGDSGHNQFNFSEVIGSGAAASIGTYCYYSRSDRNASNVMTVWGTQLGIDTFVTVLKEFWPDIRRKLHGSK
jgi:hypothetical protein